MVGTQNTGSLEQSWVTAAHKLGQDRLDAICSTKSDSNKMGFVQFMGGELRIPESIGSQTKVENLFLMGAFTEIPEEVGDMERLKRLTIVCIGTQPKLPESLKNLEHLVSLRLKSVEVSRRLRDALQSKCQKVFRLEDCYTAD